MKYINGSDLPEHIQTTLKNVVTKGSTAGITTRFGQAVLISKETYDQLIEMRDDRPSVWNGLRLDHELDGYLRDEIDY